MSASSDNLPSYMPQLDGLRGLAVAGVMLSHFSSHPVPTYRVALGSVGVRLFFVLSGFLITRILLDSRRRMDEQGATFGHALKVFYARRTLRIFPIYYLTLLGAAIALPQTRSSLWMHAIYISNWVALGGAEPPLGHFWSLAVEEQFYILWPTAVLLLPVRWVPRVGVAMLLIAPLSRLVLTVCGFNIAVTTDLTTSCLDTLGAGSLLAAAAQWHGGSPWTVPFRFCWVCGVIAFLALMMSVGTGASDVVPITFGDSALVLCFVPVVGWAATGSFAGPIGMLLRFPPLVYVGKISYGLYVYHYFAPWLIPPACNRFGWNFPDDEFPRMLIYAAASLAVATASWFLLEKPINGLKRFFPY